MIPELIIAITLASEAIGEPLFGKQMVASVIVNRMVQRKTTAVKVCWGKKQFSFWNNKVFWFGKLPPKTMQEISDLIDKWRTTSPEQWADCMELAVKIHNGRFIPLSAANHYYAPKKVKKKKKWMITMTHRVVVGNHIFGVLD